MSFPASIPGDPFPPPPPQQWRGEDKAGFIAEQDSLRRAMPTQRLIGSGMSFNDATVLHQASDAGVSWDICGEWLGERNIRLAKAADTPVSERRWYRFGSACFRAAQSAIPADTDRKRHLFTRMMESFASAGRLDEPTMEKHEIAWRGASLCGWLMRPPGDRQVPVVIVMGGFDGWREEYYPGAKALVDRGLAAFLVDGPGQGETRLFHRLYLDTSFPDAFAIVAEYLRTRCAVGPRLGIWGNSLGGFLAAKTAAVHPGRFDALCVNGGTIRPLELPERFPRFFEKVEALLGTTDRNAVMNVMKHLDLRADASAIDCPLLQLHSTPDQVFRLDNARLVHDLASSADKQLLVWEDGDHCMYNHAEERDAIVADWFVTRLTSST